MPTQITNVFQVQLKKLLDYLEISVGTFTNECEFSTNAMVQGYLDGTYQPTFKSINKILKRYPVEIQWLMYDIGEMWKKDYFEERFHKYCKDHDGTLKGKIECLQVIFEASMNMLAKRFGVQVHIFHNITGGKVHSISDDNIDIFVKSVAFIPKKWYNQ